MLRQARQQPITESEYLQGELLCEVRHEYLGGEVHAMGGASDRHNLISGNLYAALRPQVRGSGCQLFMSDMKVRLEAAGDLLFYYPDLLLSCDPEDRASYFRSRPCLIVEVLSDSTERVDRREKLFAYTTIETLQSYLLLAQDQRRAVLHRRADGWKPCVITEGEVTIDCLGLSVSLDAIYDEVELPIT